ncbi:MAG: glycosyltransferase family 39 protein, partial [Candidatus Koribacter versatilis]|nr:glycosyltransferase family 39 protein [Candidatus Koribacter versatilis]
MRKHLIGAVSIGLALRLFFVWRYPAVAGDTGIYEQLARNWLDHGIYGEWINGVLTPVDLRAPGYPAFLAAVFAVLGRSDVAVRLAQVFVDLITCLLAGGLAAWLAPEESRRRVAAAAVWLAALCPFVANYVTVPLTEVLATFLTTAALLVLLFASAPVESAPRRAESGQLFFLGAFIAGLGTLVRPETPLLLAAVGLVLCIRWRRMRDWPRLVRAGMLMAMGLALPLLPWAARNYFTLGEVQFLAPRHAELPGELVPRGFYSWTNTWLVRFRDVYLVPWRLDSEAIPLENVNPAAFDSPEERARVAALFERYNETITYTPALDAEFAALARERIASHPLRTFLWVPLQRAATFWFTPRIELLPYSGHLWPLAQQWEEDPVDFLVTLAFGFLNFLFVGLALAGAWRLWNSSRAQTTASTAANARLGLWM